MSRETSSPTLPLKNPLQVYDTTNLFFYAMAAVAVGMLTAGFWNYHLVDGFGKDVIAGATIGETSDTIGETSDLAGSYSSPGAGFGFLFAAVAGAVATFTACNCVVFALLPGLACSVEDQKTLGIGHGRSGMVYGRSARGLRPLRTGDRPPWRCSIATRCASRRHKRFLPRSG